MVDKFQAQNLAYWWNLSQVTAQSQVHADLNVCQSAVTKNVKGRERNSPLYITCWRLGCVGGSRPTACVTSMVHIIKSTRGNGVMGLGTHVCYLPWASGWLKAVIHYLMERRVSLKGGWFCLLARHVEFDIYSPLLFGQYGYCKSLFVVCMVQCVILPLQHLCLEVSSWGSRPTSPLTGASRMKQLIGRSRSSSTTSLWMIMSSPCYTLTHPPACYCWHWCIYLSSAIDTWF